MDVNLSELRELVIDREAWHAVTHGVAKSQTQLSNWTELNWTEAGNGKVKIDLLGISELKWTGMGKFNSDDHYIYYYGQESLRRNGVALIVNKRVWNEVVGYNLRNNRRISVHFQGKTFTITVIQVYAPTGNVEEA